MTLITPEVSSQVPEESTATESPTKLTVFRFGSKRFGASARGPIGDTMKSAENA
jgi:hypothetical protein